MSGLNSTFVGLLHQLSNGAWHSGEALGQSLGVSRAAISKHVKQLSALGLDVERQTGRGYRLSEPLDLHDSDSLSAQLETSFPQLTELHVPVVIDSTNAFLLSRLRANGRCHAELCLAEQQSSGRGRRGRAWFSPFAKNVYFSLSWHFEGGVAAIEGLSLAVGVAVNRALERLGINEVRLKWPNDLLVGDRKLGGILIELGGDAVGDCAAIIGLGLNVHMQSASEAEVNQPWVSLSELGYEVRRDELVMALLAELVPLLTNYEQTGFASLCDEWNERNAHQSRKVQLASADQITVGTMLGVDASGALLLDTGETVRTFIGGEVSLRSAGAQT